MIARGELQSEVEYAGIENFCRTKRALQRRSAMGLLT
jgi:hypothetical protein